MSKTQRAALGAFLLLVLAATGTPAASAATTLKLATLVPDGSVWDKALKEMGDEWRRATDGRVALRIYPGGVAGDETDVLRKMRIGQLHAGTLTIVGLSAVDPSFNVLGVPLFFESYDELFYVLERLRPELERRLEERGYVLVNWGYGGWVHFFSKSPVATTEDLKRARIFVWGDDESDLRWWKELGYQPVPLAATDIMTGLQTGMIDVLRTTPLAALSLQWFRQTPYMNDLGLGPLTGATIVTKKTWEKIAAGDRELLLSISRRFEERQRTAIAAQDRLAIEQMTERGLTVTVTENRERWLELADGFGRRMRGGSVPEDVFDLAFEIRRAYREAKAEPETSGEPAATGGPR